MAAPKTLKESKFLVQISDGAGGWIAPCAINTKGIDLTAETNDASIRDCDNPDAPAFVQRIITSLSAGVSGSGRLATESLQLWRDWWLSGAAKDVRVKFDTTGANGGGYFAMSAVLTGLKIGAAENDFATIDVSIQSNGTIAWTDAA